VRGESRPQRAAWQVSGVWNLFGSTGLV